jgi:hypothetical protein
VKKRRFLGVFKKIIIRSIFRIIYSSRSVGNCSPTGLHVSPLLPTLEVVMSGSKALVEFGTKLAREAGESGDFGDFESFFYSEVSG